MFLLIYVTMNIKIVIL